MESRSTRVDILQQLFATATPAQKAAFLEWAKSLSKNDAKSISKVESATTFDAFLTDKKGEVVCPHCGSTHIRKNGHIDGRQRFVCVDCRKTFGFTYNTILHQSKKDIATWSRYIECMMERMPLRKTAKICGINLATSFAWRHKILDALTNMMDGITLDGVVEADETYQLISFKGNHKKSKTFTMPRKAHKRGGKATKRGLSDEQVCVTSGVNLGGLSVGRISNLGKPSYKELGSVLDGHVAIGSIFVTDSHRGYCKLADAYGVSHIRIPKKHHTAQGFNIQTINYYHSALKGMINWHFRGVATKYLNNYVVRHNLVNFAKGSESEKEEVMRDFVLTTKCLSFWKKNLMRPAVPCVA